MARSSIDTGPACSSSARRRARAPRSTSAATRSARIGADEEALIEGLVADEDVLPAQHRADGIEEPGAADGEPEAEIGLERGTRREVVVRAAGAHRDDRDGTPFEPAVNREGRSRGGE